MQFVKAPTKYGYLICIKSHAVKIIAGIDKYKEKLLLITKPSQFALFEEILENM
jgi:hypothetical protein